MPPLFSEHVPNILPQPKKKIKLAYEESSEAPTPAKKNKRRERRERDAKVRAGELALPTPVIEFDAAKKVQLKTVRRCGIELYVRRVPYQSQLQVIDCALRAMNSARSAFLESPTGTGKTAAGLAAALAWQRVNAKKIPTRVVWVARTHDQLQHAVEEYRRSCAERPLMSLRLSRERFCLHPDIAVAPNKAEACEEATKVEGGSTFRNSGCGHLDKAESIGYPQSRSWRKHFLVGGKMNTWNIEDAVNEGNKLTVCPFHMAQDQIQQGAGLVFITYQQLVEPIIRRAGGLDQVLEDAVIVVDEAHNLPQVARDAASLDLTETRLEQIIQTLVDFLPQIELKHKEAHDMLASLVVSSSGAKLEPAPKKTKKKKLRFEQTTNGGPLVSLLHWLRRSAQTFEPLTDPSENTKDELVWDGDAAAILARDVLGLVSADRIDENCKILWKLRKTLIEQGLESGAVRSDTINDLEAILVKLRYVLEPNAARHYRLVVLKERTQIQQQKTLRFVCLSGAVAMQTLTRGQRAPGLGKAEYLRPARSLLLMSGTLRPMDLLATELGFEQVPDKEETEVETAPPPPPLQNDEEEEEKKPPLSKAFQASSVAACHLTSVVKGSLLPLRLDEACGGVSLDASYKHSTQDPESREARDYFDALARALLGVASASPSGMLVFFKSYKLLHLALDRWTSTDAKSALVRVKPMFVEESGLTGEDFDARLVEYRAAAKTSKGAMLLAVMRGRAAEGADFKDEAARVVCVVGVPYPPRFDVATRLKLQHEAFSQGADAGERWYKAEAYRNVNQAAGRLIRHKHDYGALVLLDKALTKHPFMSDWYANRLETLSGATELHNRLKEFFAKRGGVPSGTTSAVNLNVS